MHIAEGILPPAHAAAYGILVAPFVAHGVSAMRNAVASEDVVKRAAVGMAGALVFALTVFPIPVPFIGVTSHLCATPALALLLGPRLVVVPTLLVLLLQALFFAHGGLLPLGANTLGLAVVGPLVAVGLARALRLVGLRGTWAVGLACVGGDLAVYAFDAVAVSLALAGEQSAGHWFRVIGASFLPVQAPLAVLEGLLSAALLRAIATRRPELPPAWLGLPGAPPRYGRTTVAVGLVAMLALGGRALAAEAPGLDETAFGGTAERAGRAPRPALVDWQLPPSAFPLSFFVAGVVVGRAFCRISRRAQDAR